MHFLKVHRLVVVDDDNKVTGVISLSDILNYLVLRPGGKKCALSGFSFSLFLAELSQYFVTE